MGNKIPHVGQEWDRGQRVGVWLLADLALQFILAHPAVSTVIVGMTNPAHVRANVAVSDAPPLPADKLARLHALAWDHGWVYPWDRRAG